MQQQILIFSRGVSRTFFSPLASPTLFRLIHSGFLRIFSRRQFMSRFRISGHPGNQPPPAWRAIPAIPDICAGGGPPWASSAASGLESSA
jgi:hypothetical protein